MRRGGLNCAQSLKVGVDSGGGGQTRAGARRLCRYRPACRQIARPHPQRAFRGGGRHASQFAPTGLSVFGGPIFTSIDDISGSQFVPRKWRKLFSGNRHTETFVTPLFEVQLAEFGGGTTREQRAFSDGTGGEAGKSGNLPELLHVIDPLMPQLRKIWFTIHEGQRRTFLTPMRPRSWAWSLKKDPLLSRYPSA